MNKHYTYTDDGEIIQSPNESKKQLLQGSTRSIFEFSADKRATVTVWCCMELQDEKPK